MKTIIRLLITTAVYMLTRGCIEIIDLLAGKEKIYDAIVTIVMVSVYCVLFVKDGIKEG